MAYQFLGSVIPFIIGIDLLLLGLVYLSTQPKRKIVQRAVYIIATLGFIGFSLFKMLFTIPAPVASTPVDLEIKTDQPFTTVYYLAWDEGQPEVFWKDMIISQHANRYFEWESNVRNGLLIAKTIGNGIGYQAVQLDEDKPTKVNLRQEHFTIDRENKIKEAIRRYRWTEYGNYLSYLLTVSFITVLVWRIIKFGF